jgi:hypothetical protein
MKYSRSQHFSDRLQATVTKYIRLIFSKVTFQLMVMILKIKAPTRNLCIVCSVTTPKSGVKFIFGTKIDMLIQG